MKVHADGAVCTMLHDGENHSLVAVASKHKGEDSSHSLLLLINNLSEGLYGIYPLGAEDVATLRDMFNLWLAKHAPRGDCAADATVPMAEPKGEP